MPRPCPERLLFLCALSSALACGGQHDPVTVAFSLAEIECQEQIESCGLENQTQGVVAEAFSPDGTELAEETGDRVLYADFPAPSGGLAIIEISQPSSGLAQIRYREVFRGEVSFAGEIVSQDVQLAFGVDDEPMLYGTFAFTAIDAERNTVRRVHSGRVMSVGVSTLPPIGPVVRVPDPAPRPPPDPRAPNHAPPKREPTGPRGPNVNVVVETSHGCSDPTPDPSGCDDPSPSSGGGCDADAASSGCEADSFDTGGCDSGGASSGCEADGFDASGCDQCSAGPPRPNTSVLHAIWRLFWPVLLVGAANRRMHRRLSRAPRNES